MGQFVVNLVDMCDVSFFCGECCIFDNIFLMVLCGKIMVIMGLLGIGKIMLLCLIGGQILLDKGEILFDGENVLVMFCLWFYIVCKCMSMLFQLGVLFIDMNVFDNVVYLLWEYINLFVLLLKSVVMMKLEVVGLCGVVKLMFFEFFGGMVCCVVLVCVIVLELDFIMFDELFVGQDLIIMGVLVKLILELNSVLGVICVVVLYDVLEVFSIVDYVWIMVDKKIVVYGSVQVLQENMDLCVCQFFDGIVDGLVLFCYLVGDYYFDLFEIGS